MLHEKPKKKRLNEGNIFVTMANPLAVYQMAEPLRFPVNDPIALYGRQSSLFQFENKIESRDYQIEEQRKILASQYKWNDGVIFEYFEDFAYSGTLGIGERVGITRLLEDIQSGFIKAVYVFLVDRLFRDKLLENVIRFAKACYEKKIIIITSCYVYRMWIQDDYDRFIEDCKLAWKALDLQLNKRMLPMRAFASHSGKYDSRAINIGYIVDRDKHSKTYKKYIPLPKHAEIVKEKLFLRLVDLGGDVLALMHELEEQPGVHFPWYDDPLFNNRLNLTKIPGVGYRIGAQKTLIGILRNKVYIGTWKTGEKEYPNNHEAIVTHEVWDAVQYLLDKRQESIRPQQRNKGQDTLLKGLILRPDPKYVVSVSSPNGEISFDWKDNPKRMARNRRDSIPLAIVEEMFKDVFTRRVLMDERCYQYAQAAQSLYKAEAKKHEHIQETITGLEAQRRAILNDLENPKIRATMSERTVEEKYEKVASIESEVGRLNAVLARPSKHLPLPDLLTLIDQLRESWDSLPPNKIRDVAIVFCQGILLTPRSNHIWSFEVKWELWPDDKGIMWLNIGDKFHWLDEDIALLKALAEQGASTPEFLEALPKFSQTAISHMSKRECGRRIIPKASYRMDAYMTREDMQVLEEYGVSIDQIAEMRGAVKAKSFNGEEYWSLAYTKRDNVHNIIFFEDRDNNGNLEIIR
jgi:hypothetical protein